jgi:HEAT repeat protein
LGQLGDNRAVEPLLGMLQDDSITHHRAVDAVRKNAIDALRKIAGKNRIHIPLRSTPRWKRTVNRLFSITSR